MGSVTGCGVGSGGIGDYIVGRVVRYADTDAFGRDLYLRLKHHARHSHAVGSPRFVVEHAAGGQCTGVAVDGEMI